MTQIVKNVKRSGSKESSQIRIVNVSGQTISIQLSVEGVDFYRGQQQVRVKSGQNIAIDEKYLIDGQVENLRGRGLLKLTKSSS